MVSKTIVMPTDGFHVLFAKAFTNAAASYESELRVVWPARNIISDAKSILGIMALDATKGTEIVITADGPDEEAALETLGKLLLEQA